MPAPKRVLLTCRLAWSAPPLHRAKKCSYFSCCSGRVRAAGGCFGHSTVTANGPASGGGTRTRPGVPAGGCRNAGGSDRLIIRALARDPARRGPERARRARHQRAATERAALSATWLAHPRSQSGPAQHNGDSPSAGSAGSEPVSWSKAPTTTTLSSARSAGVTARPISSQFANGSTVVVPQPNDCETSNQALVLATATSLSQMGGALHTALVGNAGFGPGAD